jgi:hypothetical protein
MVRAGTENLEEVFQRTSYSMVDAGRTRKLCMTWEADESELGCEILPLD